MNSRANIIKPSKDGSFSPLQRAWQAVARRFTVGRDAVKPNFGSTESEKEFRYCVEPRLTRRQIRASFQVADSFTYACFPRNEDFRDERNILSVSPKESCCFKHQTDYE